LVLLFPQSKAHVTAEQAVAQLLRSMKYTSLMCAAVLPARPTCLQPRTGTH